MLTPPCFLAWPHVRVHIPISGGGGLSFLHRGVHQRPSPTGRGDTRLGGSTGRQHRAGGVSRKRFHNPCLCAVRQHVHCDFTSPVLLSQGGAQCLLAQPRIYTPAAACKTLPGKKQNKTKPRNKPQSFCKQARAVPWHDLPGRPTCSSSLCPLAWVPWGPTPALSPNLPRLQQKHHREHWAQAWGQPVPGPAAVFRAVCQAGRRHERGG